VPRSIALNESAPRRRKTAAAKEKERGLIMQLLFHSPKDALASAVAVSAVLAIIVNALFLQAGRHPSPLFATVLPSVKPVVESKPAPVATATLMPQQQQSVASPQAVASPMPRPRPAEAEMRPGDPLGNLVRTTSMSPASSVATPRPPVAIPQGAKSDSTGGQIASSARVAAVQRALTDYGYGQLKATGTVGADTQAAIQKFERERKLPLTGQVSERLVRELGLATGRSFE
jgi:hypothetical protein